MSTTQELLAAKGRYDALKARIEAVLEGVEAEDFGGIAAELIYDLRFALLENS